MLETVVKLLLALAGVYAGSGIVFALMFHLRGLRSVDHGAQGAGWFFRLLITPGIVVLWPLLAGRWRRFAQGSAFAGAADAPVRPARLRALHALAWKLLAVLVPLLVAAALYWRPGPETPAPAEVVNQLRPTN
jgi:hypothetical protein